MATITDKIITLPKLQKFKEKADEVYVIETELESTLEEAGYKTEDDLKETFVETDTLGEYKKTTDLEKEYVKKDGSKVLSDNNFDNAAKAITDKADETYATKTELGSKLDSTTAASTYVAKEGFDEEVKKVTGRVYKIKESVDNAAALESIKTTSSDGDVRNVNDTGANYVYVESETEPGEGKGTWDKLSETVDVSGKLDASTAADTYLSKTDAEKTYAKTEDLPSFQEATDSDIEGLFTV